MKFFSTLAVMLLSVLLLSCESSENSIVSPSDGLISNQEWSIMNLQVGIDLDDLDNIFNVEKEIDGSIGGELALDTIYTDAQGNLVSIEANLKINPNSFNGTQNIKMSPDPLTGSVRFSPAMIFNTPLELNLKFKGIDLSNLGFDPDTEVDFVFISADGTTETIDYDDCKMKWNYNELKVKKARIQHFSRYVFVRKS